jgi:predicted phage-related endonuclease
MSTPPYTRINLTQQTDEWRQWRRSVVGASHSPVIIGESKWNSADTLLKEKLDERPEFTGNFKTRQGNQLEPVAREHFEAHAKVLTPQPLNELPKERLNESNPKA